MLKPKTLGLWANTDKDIFWNILPEIIEWAKRKKFKYLQLKKSNLIVDLILQIFHK